MKWIIAVALCALGFSAFAQAPAPPTPGPFSSTIIFCWNGTALAACGSAGTGGSPVPLTAAPTQSTVSCGTGNTTLLAAGAATQFITVKNPAGNARVWINWAGASAVAAAPSFDLGPDASFAWTTFVPSAQINCIVAAGSASVTLIYK